MMLKKFAVAGIVAGAVSLLSMGNCFAEGREHMNWDDMGIRGPLKQAIAAGKAGDAAGYSSNLKAAYDKAREENKKQPDTDIENLIIKGLRPVKDNETLAPAAGATELEKVLSTLQDR
jgi:hypothetical protein